MSALPEIGGSTESRRARQDQMWPLGKSCAGLAKADRLSNPRTSLSQLSRSSARPADTITPAAYRMCVPLTPHNLGPVLTGGVFFTPSLTPFTGVQPSARACVCQGEGQPTAQAHAVG